MAGLVGLLILLTSCGDQAATPTADTSLPAVVDAPATLAADGSVPFVDERAGEREFDSPMPVDPDPGDAKPCQADQLQAVLPSWFRQGAGNEPGRRPTPGIYGFALVSSRDGRPCTLQGKVAVRLRIDGQEAPVGYATSISDEAVKRITLVDAQHRAELRVDWGPPYCGPKGRQDLAVALPHDGGILVVPVQKPETPVCAAGGEVGDDARQRTNVSASAFTPYVPPTLADSPLGVLTAKAEGVPAGVRPGELLRFRVRLSNPTGAAVSLRPCPGFFFQRTVLGVDRVGYNVGQLYRLNCRPVTAIPAHGSVVFQMEAKVPDDPPGGPTFNISWHLVAPHLAGLAGLRFGFAVPLRD